MFLVFFSAPETGSTILVLTTKFTPFSGPVCMFGGKYIIFTEKPRDEGKFFVRKELLMWPVKQQKYPCLFTRGHITPSSWIGRDHIPFPEPYTSTSVCFLPTYYPPYLTTLTSNTLLTSALTLVPITIQWLITISSIELYILTVTRYSIQPGLAD